MHEGDPPSRRASPRNLVDQAVSCLAACLQGCIEIWHSVTDVVNTGTALGQEFCDRAVRREWGEQFDLGLTEWKRKDGGAVGHLGGVGHQAEDVPVKRQRRFEIGDGNSDMGNPGAISH